MTDWRMPHESDEEWRLRQEFINAYRGRFPDNRLQCLSSCLVNVECYGCRYPEPVMKLLSELSVGLQEVTRRRNAVTAKVTMKRIQFVPASSEADEANVTFGREKTDAMESPSDLEPGLVKSVKEETSKVGPVHDCVPGSCSSEKITVSSGLVKRISHEPSNIAEQRDSRSLNVRVSANELSNIPNSSDMVHSFYRLGSAIKEIAAKLSCDKSDTEILQMGLDKCRLIVVTQFTQTGSTTKFSFVCTLLINHVHVAVAESSTKKAAKHAAYSKAVELLQMPCLRIDDQFHLIGTVEPFQRVPATSSDCRGASSSRAASQPKSGSVPKANESHAIPRIRPLIPSLLHGFGNTNTFNHPRLNSASKKFVQQALPPRVRPLIQPSFYATSSPVGRSSVAGDSAVLPQQKLALSEMVLLHSATFSDYTSASSCLHVLQQSASFNGCRLDFEYSSVGSQWNCRIMIDGQDVSSATSDCETSAKLAAALHAISELGKTCCTVIVKSPEDVVLDESIKRTEVVDGGADPNKIPESNIGSLLLKKMGWTGGGVGKDGNVGIEEPISVTAVVNRAGLGSGVSGDFAKAVSKIVTDYLRSDRQDDLVFSPEFTNQERAAIHFEARKRGKQLRTRSYGSKDARYLVLSRRRSRLELVQHIRNNGGETLKYILVEPSG